MTSQTIEQRILTQPGANVLGIDPSHTHTGIFSTFHERGMTLEPGERRGPERLDFIERLVRERIERERPQLLVIEGYDYKSQRAHMAGEVGGVLRLLFYRMGYGERYCVVPPNSLKLFATGNGNADKKLMMRAAEKRFGRKFPDDHQADAFWLAVLGLCILQRPTEWRDINPRQIEIIQAVKANPTGQQRSKNAR